MQIDALRPLVPTVGGQVKPGCEYRFASTTDLWRVVGRKNSIGVFRRPIGTHGAARQELVLI